MSIPTRGPHIESSERDLQRSSQSQARNSSSDVRRSRLVIEQQQEYESGRIERRSGRISISSKKMSQDDSELECLSPLTDRVPALTRSSSIASLSSVDTRPDTATAGYMLQFEDGVFMLPEVDPPEPLDDLLCPFQILDCDQTFADVRDFKYHVFSHFRGYPTLPTFAPCFLCDEKFEQTAEDESALAWNLMLSHMVHQHFRRGQDRGTIRADFGLMRWMYHRKIIDDQDFKRMQDCPQPIIFPSSSSTNPSPVEEDMIPPLAPSPPRSEDGLSSGVPEYSIPRASSIGYHGQAYVTFAGPRAERRRRESLRPGSQRYARRMG